MLSRRLLRIKTIKSLYGHFQSDEVSLIKSEKEFQRANGKCYELYVLLMDLVVDVADYANKRIEIGLNKLRPTPQERNPNMRFVNNQVIDRIRHSQNLTNISARHKASWGSAHELIVKDLYEQMQQSPYFLAYMNGEQPNFDTDRKMVANFYRKHIEDNEIIEEALESESIYWVDDLEYALGFVISTINSIKENSEDIDILPMYKNDEDREFGHELFRKSLVNNVEYFGYIDTLTENWDFERIAFMDRIIMLAAITELIQFPSIPVKVTLDEYIDISKYYSTQSSGQFINGILDKAITKFTEEGKIKKAGRGLIDQSIDKDYSVAKEASEMNEEEMDNEVE